MPTVYDMLNPVVVLDAKEGVEERRVLNDGWVLLVVVEDGTNDVGARDSPAKASEVGKEAATQKATRAVPTNFIVNPRKNLWWRWMHIDVSRVRVGLQLSQAASSDGQTMLCNTKGKDKGSFTLKRLDDNQRYASSSYFRFVSFPFRLVVRIASFLSLGSSSKFCRHR